MCCPRMRQETTFIPLLALTVARFQPRFTDVQPTRLLEKTVVLYQQMHLELILTQMEEQFQLMQVGSRLEQMDHRFQQMGLEIT
ncbi:hypothetical protein KIN20_004028 [Parelaphostrongylus tenuis]|uniref:Uncharacterized protein n=1 Tax=Parelaphostrongylus tenuis TaxID=148309 RepID=A0AAD5LY70_PARTN|nr:hypothetical protein KIN20_004028 [Parelaphostrongylus tenuis]